MHEHGSHLCFFFFLLLNILSVGLNMCIKTDNCLFFNNIVKIHILSTAHKFM